MNGIQHWITTPHVNTEALWAATLTLTLLAPVAQQLNNILTTCLTYRHNRRTLHNLDTISTELHTELDKTTHRPLNTHN